MEKLSVVIITYNEEKNIERCLNSLKPVADEIIVLDSFSSDRTVDLARKHGARVWQEPFRGYIEQKNRAIELASYNYIMSIDADEAIDAELQKAIATAKQTFKYSAYRMKRCTNHCGRFIRHGTWYPDRKIRLFDKRVACWGGLNPHDKIVFSNATAVKQLPGEILHYSFATIDEHIAKNDRFSSIVAKSYYKAGRKTNLFRVIVHPAWSFMYGFFLRKGFMDGAQGFVIAWNQARYTYQKHKKLFRLQTGLKRKQLRSDIQPTANADRLPRNIRAHVTGQE